MKEKLTERIQDHAQLFVARLRQEKEKLLESFTNRILLFAACLYEEGIAPHAILSFLRIKIEAFGQIWVDKNTIRAAEDHTSHLDTLAVTEALNSHNIYNVHPVASGEYWTPFLKQIGLRIMYGYRTYLTKKKSDTKTKPGYVAHEIARILNTEEDIVRVIFPQGGRNRGDVLESGTFVIGARLAMEEQVDVPIQLVIIENMDARFQKGSNMLIDTAALVGRAAFYFIINKHHTVRVTFMEPISPMALATLTGISTVEELTDALKRYYRDQYADHSNKAEFTPMKVEDPSYITMDSERNMTPVVNKMDATSASNEPYQFLAREQD